MKRRDFLKTLGAGSLAAGGLSGAAGAGAADRYNWKLVTAWPPNFPIFQQGIERFAADVETMSGGRLRISAYAGGELVPPLEVLDAVSKGTVQMGHGTSSYWADRIPAAPLFSAVPFGMTGQETSAWLYSGGGLELWHEIYKPHNLIAFPLGTTGMQMGGWFRKKLTSAADLRGLRMRIPGLGGKVMAKAGAKPVLLSGGEIYSALEKGSIDAAEWVGPFHDMKMGLHRAANYYYYPGWQEPSAALELIVNLRAWASLPADLKLIVQTAAQAANTWMYAQFEAQNPQALRALRDQYGVQVLPFPDAIIKELKRLTKAVMEEESRKDANFKRVHAAYEGFRIRVAPWAAVSDQAYARALAL